MKDSWDFVEEYFPNYHSDIEIAINNDLSCLLNGELESEDVLERLNTVYDGDINNPAIFADYQTSLISIYEQAIENFIRTNNK